MFKEPKKTMLKELEACMTAMPHQIQKTTKETENLQKKRKTSRNNWSGNVQ